MNDFAIYQEDCLTALRRIKSQSIDLVLTDPPYGVTRCEWDAEIPIEPLFEELNRVITPTGVIVLFGTEPFSSKIRIANRKIYKYDWVWNKKQAGTPLNARRQPLKIHENIMVFGGKTYNPVMRKGKMRKKGGLKSQPSITGQVQLDYTTYNDEYYPVSILPFNSVKRKNRSHPTEKPVDLLEYLISTYTNESDRVLDFAMGSGSTGVAALNLKRKFIGMETNKEFFDIACNRLEKAWVERWQREKCE